MRITCLLFPLLLCVSLTFATEFTLNNIAYAEYYTTNCENNDISNKEYKEACSPFTAEGVWNPIGVPAKNDSVTVQSDTPLNLIIQQSKQVELFNLTLIGQVTLIIHGSLSSSSNIYGNCFIMVENNGILNMPQGLFNGNTTMIQNTTNDGKSGVYGSVTVTGYSSYYFYSGISKLSSQGEFLFFEISGNAQLDNSITTSHLSVSDNAIIDIVFVTKTANIKGTTNIINQISAIQNSVVEIDSCPKSSSVFAKDNSNILIRTNNAACYLPQLKVYDQSTITSSGNSDIVIEYLIFAGSPTLSFINTDATEKYVKVTIPSTVFCGKLKFDGNFDVFAGSLKFEGIVLPLEISALELKNGKVNLRAKSVKICGTFELDPNLNLIAETGGMITIENGDFTITDNLIMEPGSTFVIGFKANIYAPSFTLAKERTILVDGRDTNITISNLVIEEGSILRVRRNSTINGNIELRGLLDLDCSIYGFLTFELQGDLDVKPTGEILSLQFIADPNLLSVTRIPTVTFFSVVGQASLGGNFTAVVLLLVDNQDNYTFTAPLMSSTSIVNKFNNIDVKLRDNLNSLYLLSHKYVQNTLYMQIDSRPPESDLSSAIHLQPVVYVFIVVLLFLMY